MAAKTPDLNLLPIVTHCAGGPGPQPTGLMEAMLAWVEDGKVPETLPAVRREQTGTDHTFTVVVSVSAGGEVQGQRQHRRRG